MMKSRSGFGGMVACLVAILGGASHAQERDTHPHFVFPGVHEPFVGGAGEAIPRIPGLEKAFSDHSHAAMGGILLARGPYPHDDAPGTTPPELRARLVLLRDCLRTLSGQGDFAFFGLEMSLANTSPAREVEGELGIWTSGTSCPEAKPLRVPATNGTEIPGCFQSLGRHAFSRTPLALNLTDSVRGVIPARDAKAWLVFLDGRFPTASRNHFQALASFRPQSELTHLVTADDIAWGLDGGETLSPWRVDEGSMALQILRSPATVGHLPDGEPFVATRGMLVPPTPPVQTAGWFPFPDGTRLDFAVQTSGELLPTRVTLGLTGVQPEEFELVAYRFTYNSEIFRERGFNEKKLLGKGILRPAAPITLDVSAGVDAITFKQPPCRLLHDASTHAVFVRIRGVSFLLGVWKTCFPLGGGKGIALPF